jgi:hypothetical protein
MDIPLRWSGKEERRINAINIPLFQSGKNIS